jgi:hypothetical protein
MQRQLILGKELRNRSADQVVLSAKIIQESDGLWHIELQLNWLAPNPFLLGEFEVRKLRQFKMLNSALRNVFEKTGLTTVTIVRHPDAPMPPQVI